jgi:hypothetical protein
MRQPLQLILALTIASLTPNFATSQESPAAKTFHEQVAPVLVKSCIPCHSGTKRSGNLSLETLGDAQKGGDEGPSIVAGKRNESTLYQKIVATAGGEPEMPKEKAPLSAAEAELIGKWIDDGAAWPTELVLKEKPKADADFWSFQPLKVAEPPQEESIPEGWRENPIDRFVFAKLKEKGLAPSTPSGARELLRRMTYGLHGLPPSVEEIAEFAKSYETNPQQAVEKTIDRLLASPRYGERWARHWLDVVRFGESRGYERNEIITNLWPFRDYIIESINNDKPFDELIREHLAGDVFGAGKPEVEIGSAFLTAGPYDDVGNSDAEAAAQIRADQMDEMVRATSEAFLGVTLGCARCHDHKFDPLKHRDFYSMASAFAGTVHGPRAVLSTQQAAEREAALKPLTEEKTRLEAEKAQIAKEDEAKIKEIDAKIAAVNAQIAAVPNGQTWWVGNHKPAPGPFHVFIGGSPQKKAEEVLPASFELLKGKEGSYELPADKTEADRRIALANWITSPHNPLTPRVLANRLWHYHFGVGIVDTPSDFGYMGGRPTHPELLDYLANKLIAGGWKIKDLHKLIMTSQAYRQSSNYREEAAKVDGDNRYLWRFSPRRLSAEEIRDSMLVAAGKLDVKMGGPGFRLYEYQQDNVATYKPLDVHGPETYRRAIYHHNARASRIDLLTDFDSPDPALGEPRRASTTSALQALTLLNHRFSLDMANFLAARSAENGSDIPTKVTRAFTLALGRPPTPAELDTATKMVVDLESKTPGKGLTAICRALFNSNEFLYLE